MHSKLNWPVEPTLGIEDFLYSYQQMRRSSIYLLSLDKHIHALRFATQTLSALDTSTRAAVLGSEKIPVIAAALKDDQGPLELRSYSFKHGIKAVLKLTQQLDRKLKPIKRLLICLLPTDTLSVLVASDSALLKSWRHWCESNGCILLILAYGDNAQKACQQLADEKNLLAGVAHLSERVNGYAYQVDYWVNSLGVEGAAEFLLQDQGTAFQLAKTVVKKVESVAPMIYLQRSVLEDAPMYMAEQWQVIDNWQELVSAAQAAASGTFVFALQATSEFEELARTLYSLRKQRGGSIRLVVREIRQVLRAPEIQLLLQSGAALVATVDIQLVQFLNMLGDLQNQHHTRPLLENLEAAIARIKPPNIKGVVSALQFVNYLHEQLAGTQAAEMDSILVVIRPVPMLTVEQVMGQLRVLRDGDVACALDGVIYLYLFKCQLEFVKIALQRIFALPFEELVASYQVHSNRIAMGEHLRRFHNIKEAHQSGVAVEQTMQDEQATVLKQSSNPHKSATDKLFKTRLKPLALAHQSDLGL